MTHTIIPDSRLHSLLLPPLLLPWAAFTTAASSATAMVFYATAASSTTAMGCIGYCCLLLPCAAYATAACYCHGLHRLLLPATAMGCIGYCCFSVFLHGSLVGMTHGVSRTTESAATAVTLCHCPEPHTRDPGLQWLIPT